MSQHHTVSCRPEHCHWGFFDAGLKPVATLASGDTVSIDCVSGGPEVLPAGSRFEILPILARFPERRPPNLAPIFLTAPVPVRMPKPAAARKSRILPSGPGRIGGSRAS